MKKSISILVAAVLTAVLAISLAACNNDTVNNDDPGEGATQSQEVMTGENGTVAA